MTTKKDKELLERQQAQAAVAREALAKRRREDQKTMSTITLSVRKTDLAALLQEATRCDMSRAELIRLIIRDYIEQNRLTSTGNKEITWKKT